jgi:hypothetical protein
MDAPRNRAMVERADRWARTHFPAIAAAPAQPGRLAISMVALPPPVPMVESAPLPDPTLLPATVPTLDLLATFVNKMVVLVIHARMREFVLRLGRLHLRATAPTLASWAIHVK